MTPLYWELQEKGQESLNHAGKISYTSNIHPDSLKASKVSRGITDTLEGTHSPWEGRVHGTQGVASLCIY